VNRLGRPASCGELFRVFNRMALQGFGGVLPVAHRELVERERWLAPAEFVELLALAQVLPGPNVVNLSLILGDRCFGWRGAVAATSGLLALPLVIVLVLGTLAAQAQDLPQVAAALRGMGAVAAGLVIATALKLLRTLRGHPLGRPAALLAALATLGAVGGARWPLVAVVIGLGSVTVAASAWRLHRQQRNTPSPQEPRA
jgi:chromate transporter